MSWVNFIWGMIAAMALTLGLVHLMVWWQNRGKPERLWFFFATVATAWMAFEELAMMKATTPEAFGSALRWLHVPTWLTFIALTGFVFTHLRAGRRWLAWLFLGIRSFSLVINFSIHPNINFREITGLRRISYLGDHISLAVGRPNPLMAVAQSALLLLVIFVLDAAITVWRQGHKRRAALTGGSIAFFVCVGTLNAILSHWQVVQLPAGGSIYFLGMIVMMAFDLSLETKRAASLELELRDTRESKHREVAHLGRVAAFGQISVSLAHEMNQPLGIILTNAQAAQRLLGKEPPDLPQVREILGDIVEENLRAGAVIERMRGLLRREEGSRQEVDPNETAREVFHLMRHELDRRGVTLTHELMDALPPVRADRIQLQQVLLNLLLNACEAMEGMNSPAKKIHLTTGSDGKSVRVTVEDGGRGLPAETETIFQAFHTTKPQGLGMGLAICRSIITAHHGQLWAEQKTTGGAAFHVVLPTAGEML